MPKEEENSDNKITDCGRAGPTATGQPARGDLAGPNFYAEMMLCFAE